MLPHIIALTVFKNMINILISTLPEHFSQNNKNNTAQLLNIKSRPITVVYKFVLKLFWQTGDEILVAKAGIERIQFSPEFAISI